MVSVIITTHNRVELLKKAIESVREQTYRDFECIVVDDASSDGTYEFMNHFHEEQFRYIRINAEDSKGGNYARNLGILHAVGEYVAFLDDDDLWMKDKLKSQVEFLEKNSDIGLVYCQLMKHDVQRDKVEKVVPDISKRGDMSEKIFSDILTVTSCIMVRKSLLEQIGYFDEALGYWQEYDLCIRICQITKVDFVKKYLVILRCDKADKNRLTNKYNGWVQAVNYQNRKYHDRIVKLSKGMKDRRRLLIYREA
jgi:glycosyltransferase involved in cell wall biosynthesis